MGVLLFILILWDRIISERPVVRKLFPRRFCENNVRCSTIVSRCWEYSGAINANCRNKILDLMPTYHGLVDIKRAKSLKTF